MEARPATFAAGVSRLATCRLWRLSSTRVRPGVRWRVDLKIGRKWPASRHTIAKFNYRIKWFDGWENHKLLLDNYNSGPSAPFNSWVLLEKEAAGAGPSDTVRE